MEEGFISNILKWINRHPFWTIIILIILVILMFVFHVFAVVVGGLILLGIFIFFGLFSSDDKEIKEEYKRQGKELAELKTELEKRKQEDIKKTKKTKIIEYKGEIGKKLLNPKKFT